MLQRRFLIITVCLSALCSIPDSSEAQEIKDVIEAVAELEAALSSVAVDSTADITRRSSHDAHAFDTLRQAQSALIEITGRARIGGTRDEIYSKANGARADRVVKFSGTFDGDSAQFELLSGQSGGSGFVTTQRTDLPWVLDVREMTTHYLTRAISQWLLEGDATIAGVSKHDGHSVVIVETKVVRKQRHWKRRFLVAPDLGFAVVKRSQCIQFPSDDLWIEFTWIAGFDFQEIQPGLWLPTRVVHESTDPQEQHAREKREPPLSWRYDIKNSNWVVNPRIDDATFKLTFSPGVLVEDKVNGRQYQVAGITDAMLDGVARLASAPTKVRDHGSRSTTARWWLVGANCAAISVVAIYLWWRRAAR